MSGSTKRECQRFLCKNTFETATLSKKYCCEKCRKRSEESRRKRGKTKLSGLPEFHHICRVCSQVFRVTTAGNHVFCSSDCREVEKEQRKKNHRNREKLLVSNRCQECEVTFDAPRKLKYCSRDCIRLASAYRARLRQYGISEEQHLHIIEQAGGACEICLVRPPNPLRLSIDHDHKTGSVRGVLCCNCNAGIGMFKEAEDRLMSAIEYLRKHTISPLHPASKSVVNINTVPEANPFLAAQATATP